MIAHKNAVLFGEDVARKGGVYNATKGLRKSFGGGRVFNTILDETTILGLAQGMSQAGMLPLPEIQYLAYLHNAIDQLRGEAGSLQFFSNGHCSNPMVIRIAGLAYQKGFGGHFHNDNALGSILEIPGLILGIPSNAADAVTMLRTMAATAVQHGKVCVFLEPIALYMQKDLHEPNDGGWEFHYPDPDDRMPLGQGHVYDAEDGDELLIVTYGNGLWMSLRSAKRLRAKGIKVRVLDLRWLLPMPMEQIVEQAKETGRVLVVDECRASQGGPSSLILAELCQNPDLADCRLRRIAAADSYVPLAAAANLVLVQEDDIERAAMALCSEDRP